MSEPLPVLEYERVNWEDAPSRVTPLSADNLNNMDNAIAALCDYIYRLENRIVDLETNKPDRSHVGMVIHSTTLDTEAKVIEVFGGVHWQRITGKFLLAADDTDYPIDTDGGSANAVLITHTHNFLYDKPSIAQHTRRYVREYDEAVSSTSFNNHSYVSAMSSATNTITGTTDPDSETEETGIGKNMPPYVAVYIWQRTE